MPEVKELLQILFERSNAAATLWNFQLTVLLALFAFLTATSNTIRSKVLLAGLTTVYAVFAVINLTVLLQIETERSVLYDAVRPELLGSGLAGLLGHIGPLLPWWGWAAVHLAGDLAAVVAIWLIPYLRRKDPLGSET